MTAVVLVLMMLEIVPLAAFGLLLFVMGISPPADDDGVRIRADAAAAIARATDDPHEQHLLASIAHWESGFRPGVATCRVAGDHGAAVSLFQVHPRSPGERRELCGSIDGSARVALARVRESLAACKYLPEKERLSAYASGSCENRAGRAASRRRWVQ